MRATLKMLKAVGSKKHCWLFGFGVGKAVPSKLEQMDIYIYIYVVYNIYIYMLYIIYIYTHISQ